jgi:hypothetical protein
MPYELWILYHWWFQFLVGARIISWRHFLLIIWDWINVKDGDFDHLETVVWLHMLFESAPD